MTAVPPPVPPEFVEKAAKALHDEVLPGCTHDEFGRDCASVAVAAIAAVYGDIVEAARRDALMAAADAIRDGVWHIVENDTDITCSADRIVAALAERPATALRASVGVRQGESGSTPARDGDGPQKGVQGDE